MVLFFSHPRLQTWELTFFLSLYPCNQHLPLQYLSITTSPHHPHVCSVDYPHVRLLVRFSCLQFITFPVSYVLPPWSYHSSPQASSMAAHCLFSSSIHGPLQSYFTIPGQPSPILYLVMYYQMWRLLVSFAGSSSISCPLTAVVHQNWSPGFSSLPTIFLSDLIRSHDFNYHLYADDSQVSITRPNP